MNCAWSHPLNVAKWWSSKVSMPSGLSRCKRYASKAASRLLNEINKPGFWTNKLILELSHQIMVHLVGLCELQDLAHTSPQGVSEMDELWDNKTEIHHESSLRFHWINEVTTRRKGYTLRIPQWGFGWIVNMLHGQSSEFCIRSTLIKKGVHWTRSIQ